MDDRLSLGDDGKGGCWVMRGRRPAERPDSVTSGAGPLEGEAALALIFHPISKPAVNDSPFVANSTEIEKVRSFIL